jgi:hypothetical protein
MDYIQARREIRQSIAPLSVTAAWFFMATARHGKAGNYAMGQGPSQALQCQARRLTANYDRAVSNAIGWASR